MVRGEEIRDVAGSAVVDFLLALSRVQVSEVDEPAPAGSITREVIGVHTDAGTKIRIECAELDGDRVRCRRDEGPWLQALGPVPSLTLTEGRFADRRLVQLEPGAVRAVELRPGPGAGGVRQSAHLDLGVWTLDAPTHPEGSAALDQVRLQELNLSPKTVSTYRARLFEKLDLNSVADAVRYALKHELEPFFVEEA